MYDLEMNRISGTEYNALMRQASTVRQCKNCDGGVTLTRGVYDFQMTTDTIEEIYEVTDEVYSRKWVQKFVKEIA